MSSNSPFDKQADTRGGFASSSSHDFQKRPGRSPEGPGRPSAGFGSANTPGVPGAPAIHQATGIRNTQGPQGVGSLSGSTLGSATGSAALAVGAGAAPTRLDSLIALLASIDMAAQPDPAAPNTLIIPLNGEPRFRIIAPADSHFMMLVADVFTGNEQEIAQMAPSLLHANYTCQRLALEAQIPGMGSGVGAAAAAGLPSDEAEAQWLPVMGLDLERMTVVLSLQIPYRRVDDEDFGDFMTGLVETIANDAEVLVQQFKAITANMA